MRTANPALNDKAFQAYAGAIRQNREGRMTIEGTVNRCGLLLVLLLFSAAWPWNVFFRSDNPGVVMPFVLGGAIAGFVVALVTIFKRTWSPVTAPVYAICEGLFLGGLSATFEARFPGIVIQAVGLTFGTLGALLLAYRSKLIRATENFKLGVFAATGGIALLYLVSFVLSFFGVSIGFIHSSGTFGILFSLFVVVVAALNLVLDFDFIESGAEHGAPKFMEWYAAFGLLVTLVWLYLEILRLLAKLSSRR